MPALPVNEIFDTLQGEGAWTGAPSTFIRLQVCAVGCPWCDTKHTWEQHAGNTITMAAMLAKTADAPTYALASLEQLLAYFEDAGRPAHVVITGGEPAVHDLLALTGALIGIGKTVQIETSGTQPLRIHPNTWVTVSPKLAMPGGFPVLSEVLGVADEIKMPVGKIADVHALDMLLQDPLVNMAEVWLQPLSTSAKATELCVREATRRGWRVSLQTHKFAGLR